jgi:hypothetical protein
MTVGAFPAVPAGERSCVGIEAIADEPPAPPLEVVVGAAEFVAVVAVVGVAEELLHPARTTADADNAISDHLRKQGMLNSILSTTTQICRDEVARPDRP